MLKENEDLSLSDTTSFAFYRRLVYCSYDRRRHTSHFMQACCINVKGQLLPETMKMFDCLVFECSFWGFILGVFEFRFSFSRRFIWGGSNFGIRILFLANYLSGVRISNFVFRTIHEFPFLECCPAGGVDFENSRISICWMLPCGRPRFWKIYVLLLSFYMSSKSPKPCF